jgi:hypothetical protein
MRSATLAKLALTATVGIGALVGQSTFASAGTPQGPGTVKVAPHTDPTIPPKKGDFTSPTPPTTVAPGGVIVLPDPEPQPDPPFDPDLPIAQPEDQPCHLPSCDKAGPHGDDDPTGCNKLLANCDTIDSDPGCTFTHGCPDDDPEPEPCQSDQGARTQCDPPEEPCRSDHDARTQCDRPDDGGTDGGTTDGGTTGGGTTGGGTDGDHGGRLPHTGVDAMTILARGLGLSGAGVALKRLGRRNEDQDQEPTSAF